MSLDIQGVLENWPFKPGEVNVRTIVGDDGRPKIQLRLDLGMLQMEAAGRPDGEKPHGFESLLTYYQDLLREYRNQHGTTDGFELDEQACELLRNEGVMYYHRYLAAFVLGDYEAVVRDTARNLEMFDFVQDYASNQEDSLLQEQYRPYLVMMHARAGSRQALQDNRTKDALAVVQKAIGDIHRIYETYDAADAVEESTELAVLKALAREIEDLLPPDPRDRLRKELEKAIQEERYEDAAGIRDTLRRTGERI